MIHISFLSKQLNHNGVDVFVKEELMRAFCYFKQKMTGLSLNTLFFLRHTQ